MTSNETVGVNTDLVSRAVDRGAWTVLHFIDGGDPLTVVGGLAEYLSEIETIETARS
jgi:hypothetical protein